MGLHSNQLSVTTARKQIRNMRNNQQSIKDLIDINESITICTRANMKTDNNKRAHSLRMAYTSIVHYIQSHNIMSLLINHLAQKQYHISMLNNYENKYSETKRAEKNNRAETSLVKLTDLKKEELIFDIEDIGNFITQSYRAENTKQYCNVLTFSSKESS